MQVHLFTYLSDNYGVLLHCPKTSQTAAIDAGDCAAYLKASEDTGWEITQIWATHHHSDHIAGLSDLATQTGAQIYAPQGIAAQSDGAIPLAHGDRIQFAGDTVEVIATPGHTLDMLNYYVTTEKLLFSGDTLFTLGCGRLFEGSADMMWASLNTLMALPDDTLVYGSHEYSVANATFAITVDPDNTVLSARQEQIIAARSNNIPTVPSNLGLEKQTNPFLRAADPSIRRHLGMEAASDADIFAEIRRRKDSF